METLKFRAWNKKRKKMYKVLHLHLCSMNGIWATVEGFDIIEQKEIHIQIQPDNIDIMQFTGLTDKNGKEIYEDDLVRILSGHIDNKKRVFQIVYAMGCFSLEPLDLIGLTTLGYYFKLCVENGVFKHWKECDGSVFEVIGNIHENPELL